MAWLNNAKIEEQFISSINIAEIRVGIELLADLNDRIHLSDWLETIIRPMFAGRIVEVGEGEFMHWRLLGRRLAKSRIQIPEPDLLIAAIAAFHRRILVTRNQKHFLKAEVPIFNPFTGERFNGA